MSRDRKIKLGLLFGASCLLGYVAWTAFRPRQHHHETSEAVGLLNKMWHLSEAYYATDHFGPDGKLLPKQFPGPAGSWESMTVCGCMPRERCPGASSVWSRDPVWLALGFSLPDPHRYIPGYTSSGTGTSATFTAYSKGDLDCDGKFAEFWRIGHIDSAGKVDGNYQPIVKRPYE